MRLTKETRNDDSTAILRPAGDWIVVSPSPIAFRVCECSFRDAAISQARSEATRHLRSARGLPYGARSCPSFRRRDGGWPASATRDASGGVHGMAEGLDVPRQGSLPLSAVGCPLSVVRPRSKATRTQVLRLGKATGFGVPREAQARPIKKLVFVCRVSDSARPLP